MAKGKSAMFNCGDHWYMDGILILLGLGYLFGMDGWGAINFKMSFYFPPWAILFLFFGIKMYMKKHMEA